MKLAIGILAGVALLPLAQPRAQPASGTAGDNLKALQQRGTEALDRERARSKAKLCNGLDNDVAVTDCLVREGKTTDADYTAYVRAVGALLRLSEAGGAAKRPRPLTFDAAEATWHAYRQQSCDAMTVQWKGGTMVQVAYPQCLLTVTWSHMNELAELYAGLWTP